jgi:hypothetical protein
VFPPELPRQDDLAVAPLLGNSWNSPPGQDFDGFCNPLEQVNRAARPALKVGPGVVVIEPHPEHGEQGLVDLGFLHDTLPIELEDLCRKVVGSSGAGQFHHIELNSVLDPVTLFPELRPRHIRFRNCDNAASQMVWATVAAIFLSKDVSALALRNGISQLAGSCGRELLLVGFNCS